MSAITDTYLRASQAAFIGTMRALAEDARWFTASTEPVSPRPRDYYAEAQAEVDAICTSLSDQAAS